MSQITELSEVDRNLLQATQVAVYELKESIDRLVEAIDRLEQTNRQRSLCKNCGHELITHILKGAQHHDQCTAIGCQCVYYQPAG